MRKEPSLKSKKHFSVFEVIIFTVLALYAISMFILLLWALNTSLKSDDVFYRDINGVLGITTEFKFSNFLTAFNYLKVPGTGSLAQYKISFAEMMFNSVIYSFFCAFCQVAATTLVAYCTAIYDCKFSRFIHSMVIVVIALPIFGSLASTITVLSDLHIYDTWFGAFALKFGFCNMYYLIVYEAFKKTPWSLAEAAFIDGASHAQVFFRVMLPMVKNLCGAVFLLFFVQYWNDYQDPMQFLPSRPTASYGLYIFMHSYENDISSVPLKVAGGVLTMLPILVVFLCFKEKLMGNLMTGGIKE